jgi:hypothetical protein
MTILRSLLILIFLSLIGCRGENDPPRVSKSQPDILFCWDGVVYYYSKVSGYTGGIAPAFNPDGSLKLCNQQEESSNGNNKTR